MTRQRDPFTRPLTGWSEPLHRYDRHRQLIRSKLSQLTGAVAVSHVSAAVMHRLPLPLVVLTVVHVTRPERRAARRSPVLHTHGAALSADEIVLVDGLPVTSPARTIMDCARSLPFAAAVELMDAALARGLLTHAELVAVASRPRIPGMGRVRAAAIWADPGSQVLSDSRNRLAFADLVDEPAQAHVLLPLGPDGAVFCADVWLPAEQVVGFVADGPDPQAPPCRAPRATPDVCRAAGRRFLSWNAVELAEPGTVERRWRLLIDEASSAPPACSAHVSVEQA